MTHVHRYDIECTWTGSTGDGYEAYDRSHRVSAPPATVELALSSDPVFRGDPTRLNPEQLVVAAAASCQLLSFLAVAARARLEVTGYVDHAEGYMPEDDPPMRITRIVLRPHIRLRDAVGEDRLRHLCEVAHRECFIANSLTTEIVIEPEFTFDA